MCRVSLLYISLFSLTPSPHHFPPSFKLRAW